jgi:hypothetical protein
MSDPFCGSPRLNKGHSGEDAELKVVAGYPVVGISPFPNTIVNLMRTHRQTPA